MKLSIFIALSFLSFIAEAEIQVQVQPSSIGLHESFQLTLSQDTPKQDNAVPDLSNLQKDFRIIGKAQRSTYTVINGQSHSSYQWIITLEAKKTGILSIPAIAIGQEYSTPLSIQVKKTSTKPNEASHQIPTLDGLFLKTKVDKHNPYVNQQILYTVSLYNSKRLLDASYQAPEVADALIIPLGIGKRYQKLINNTDYMVEEQNYAIFPQKSGELNIKSPIFTALVYDFNPRKLVARDKDSTLKIEPIPKNYQGQEWLPAKQISLTEDYEHQDRSQNQGSTLIRQINISGKAVPAQLLPELHFKSSDAYNVYAEKGKERNQIIQGELVGSTSFKVTYLFKKPGRTVIPEIKLPWFNTQTNQEMQASLPARGIDIKANQAITPNTAPPEASSTPPLKHPTQGINWTLLMAILFASAWVLTLIIWFWQKKGYRPKQPFGKALHELKTACLENNPNKARIALLKWASLQWPDALIISLNDLNKLSIDPSFNTQLHLLSEALYKSDSKSVWHGLALYQCVQAVREKRVKKAVNQSSSLPPINPI